MAKDQSDRQEGSVALLERHQIARQRSPHLDPFAGSLASRHSLDSARASTAQANRARPAAVDPVLAVRAGAVHGAVAACCAGLVPEHAAQHFY